MVSPRSTPHAGASGRTVRRWSSSRRSTSTWNETHQRPARSFTVAPNTRAAPTTSRLTNQVMSSRAVTFPTPGNRTVQVSTGVARSAS
ncbi:MAG TPA: hypothetical protein VM677_13680 [Actinokineospora sp.]|nr:hypothetical protein [Actinokineospora sp.]